MPKAAANSRNPAVPPQRAARRSAGATRPFAQPGGTMPETESNDLGPGPYRLGNARAHPPRAKQDDGDPDEVIAVEHAECQKALSEAQEVNRQLTADINAQRRRHAANVQQYRKKYNEVEAKNQQFRLEIQKQSDELRRLQEEVSQLQQLLDAANSDARNLVSRTELQRILEGIHAAGNTFMGHIQSQIGENQNAQNLNELPGIDMAGDWLNIPGFGVHNDAGFEEVPGPVFPRPDPDARNI